MRLFWTFWQMNRIWNMLSPKTPPSPLCNQEYVSNSRHCGQELRTLSISQGTTAMTKIEFPSIRENVFWNILSKLLLAKDARLQLLFWSKVLLIKRPTWIRLVRSCCSFGLTSLVAYNYLGHRHAIIVPGCSIWYLWWCPGSTAA